MKKNLPILLMLAIIGVITGYSASVRAQGVDYGALEALFGEPITTSATGTPQRASEVPAEMTIITADQIRRAGTRNIPQILGIYVPGLDILQSSNTSFDVGIRGYQQPFQPRLLVLVDGRQVFIDDYSRTIWENIPVNVDDIRQIEVVKGASSALFGSNAAGGVINIITYSPLYDNNNVASISGGTQSGVMADATATTKLGDWGGLKISAGGLGESQFHTPRPAAEKILSEDPTHRYITERSAFQITPNLLAGTEMTYSSSQGINAIPEYAIDRDAATTYSLRGGIAWKSPYGMISNSTYLNHTEVNILSNPGASNIGLTTNLLVSQLADQFKVGSDHTFHLKLEYRYSTFKPDLAITPGNNQKPYFDHSNYAVSGTWLWQINDQLSWTNAARFDHLEEEQTGTLITNTFYTSADYSHDINTYSLNSGLVYRPTDLDTFRATYGRGVQIPSFIEANLIGTVLNPAAPGITVDLEGNPRLKPTIMQNYELDYDRKLPDILSTARLAAFYQLNQDIVSPTIVGGLHNGTYLIDNSQNVGNSKGWGGEFEIYGQHPGGFRWNASYSYARIYDSPGVSTNLNYAGSTPQHHFRINGGYTMGAWEFDANTQILTSSNMLRSFDGGSTMAPINTDAYVSFGGRIGYNINDHLTLALSGTNINNNVISTSPYPAVERQAFLTLTGKL